MTATVALAGLLATAGAQSAGKSADCGVLDTAIFAGGCFWCMQPPFANREGVKKVIVGYTGGSVAHPTYEQVSGGGTGHYEAVEVFYDPGVVGYRDLVEIFWRNIDPSDEQGQFADHGRQYMTAIFHHTEEQRRVAEESKAALQKSGLFKRPIATKILPAVTFYPAEDYHQDYYIKNPTRYQLYKKGSGREDFIHKTWGAEKGPAPSTYVKPPDAALKKKLTPLQYNVTMCSATEPPFRNEYWDNHREGLYVDRVSGVPLFSSRDKYESGTGWPSFTQPIDKGNLVEKTDRSPGSVRTEVRSRQGDAHLGHLFTDGPAPTGMRYCMNSAALRFIPKEDLEKEGYGRYLDLFGK